MSDKTTGLRHLNEVVMARLVIWRCKIALLFGEYEVLFTRLPRGRDGQLSPMLLAALEHYEFGQPHKSARRPGKNYCIGVHPMYD